MYAAAIALLVQAAAPSAAPPPIGQFQRTVSIADIAIMLAQERACGYRRFEREAARLRGRLDEVLRRGEDVFGDEVGRPVNLVEPARDGPACQRFHESVRISKRLLDEAEALLASAPGGISQ